MKTTIVLLGHRSGVGKDSLAARLWPEYRRLAFADKLKDTVGDLYHFSREQMYGRLKDVEDNRYLNHYDEEHSYFTPRRILQIFGQQQRLLYTNIWADYVFKKEIPVLIHEGEKQFVITDLRFPNEIQTARMWESEAPEKRQAIIIRIDRVDRPEMSGAGDISETALDGFHGWNYVLTNDGTIDELQAAFRAIESDWIK